MGSLSSPPKDRYSISLYGSFLLGLAVLVPWNFFVTAEDYWKYKFRDDDAVDGRNLGKPNDNQKFFISYLSTVCNGIFLLVLFINTIFTNKISSVSRITGSLLGTTGTMILATAFVMIDTDSWKSDFLVLSLVIAGATSLLVAVLNGSSTGICGFLPERFMAANLLGQSVGGVLCALIQIGCLFLGLSSQKTALLFFSVGVVILLIASMVWQLMKSTEFFRHHRYIATCADNISISDVSCMPHGRSTCSNFLKIYIEGWEFHVTAFIVALISMPIFPGLGYAGVSKHADESPFLAKFFLPIGCFLTYSVADVFGRYLENFYAYNSSRRKVLVALSCIRVVLIPLLLVCNLSPANRKLTGVLIREDSVFVLIMSLAGFSNGYLLNVAFKNGPKSTVLEHQETSATILVCFYATGAVLGSGLSILVTMLI